MTDDPEHAADLVRRAAAGDHAAWEELVDTYSGLIWSVANSHGLDARDVADVAQTTWLRLLEHIDRLSEPHRVRAWLVTTARRESLRTKERSARMVLVADTNQTLYPSETGEGGRASFEDEVDDQLLHAERERLFRAAFAQLPASSQQLLRLLMRDPSPSYMEVSQTLNIPIGSIGPTRMRCVAKLQRIIRALSGEPAMSTQSFVT